MYESKLIFLLKTLKKNRREILEFEKFVKSPYFNVKQEVINLFLFIKKYWNASEQQQANKLDKELAYRAIFPKAKDYQAWKINERISDLSLLLEEFFAIQELKKNEHRRNMLTTEGLKNRGIDKFFFKKVITLQQEYQQKKTGVLSQNADFYREQMWLDEQVFYHPNQKEKLPTENNNRLRQMEENLDRYYIIKKLQFACEVYSRQLVFEFQFTPFLLDEIKTEAELIKNEDSIVRAYLYIIKLFETKDEGLVEEAKLFIFDLVENNNFENSLDLLLKLINALPDHKDRLNWYFDIFKFAVEKQVLIQNGYINQKSYSNIIHLGCVLEKDDWILNFIENYTTYLKQDEDRLENVKRLFLAQFNFYKKDYRKAFIVLDEIKLKNVSFGLRRYTLLFRTIIEGENEIGFKFDFDTYVQNFKAYLLRKFQAGIISLSLKNGCLLFVNTVAKIYYWEYKSWNKDKLNEKLDSNNEIPFKAWLRKQLKLLK